MIKWSGLEKMQHVIQVTSVHQCLSNAFPPKEKQWACFSNETLHLFMSKFLWISHIIHHPHITPANFFSNNIIKTMLCCKITPCAAKTLNLCNFIFLYWTYRMRMRRGTKVAPHVLHALRDQRSKPRICSAAASLDFRAAILRNQAPNKATSTI